MASVPQKRNGYEEGSLDQYLRDISIYPLINREQEVALALRIRENDQEAAWEAQAPSWHDALHFGHRSFRSQRARAHAAGASDQERAYSYHYSWTWSSKPR